MKRILSIIIPLISSIILLMIGIVGCIGYIDLRTSIPHISVGDTLNIWLNITCIISILGGFGGFVICIIIAIKNSLRDKKDKNKDD